MKKLAVVAALFVAGAAHADTPPSVWERAKNPEVGDDYALHLAALGRLESTPPEEQRMPGVMDAQLRGVIAMLQAAGAATSKNPLLRFDLALVYEEAGSVSHLLSDHQKAAELYKSALAEFPSYPDADDAWSELAQACGHTGDRQCELNSWHEVLRRRTQPFERGTPTLNLAETEMHEGDLKSAIEGYEEALSIASRSPGVDETAPLAEWGLAVANDRAGDQVAAEHDAKLALDLQRSTGHPDLLHEDDHVYFVPAYEVHWYEALGAIALARAATAPHDRFQLWEAAETAFSLYVRSGETAHDRWLPIAKARLAQCHRERLKAEAEARKAPAAEPEPMWPPGFAPPPGAAPQVHTPPGSNVIRL